MEIKKKIRLTRIGYLNYINENDYMKYIDANNMALDVVLNGILLREYNDKKVYKLEKDDSYILVTLTDKERMTNIIIHENRGEDNE